MVDGSASATTEPPVREAWGGQPADLARSGSYIGFGALLEDEQSFIPGRDVSSSASIQVR